MEKEIDEEQDVKESFKSLRGILSDVKMSSIELQKEALRWRAERYFRKRKKWMSEENHKEKIKS